MADYFWCHGPKCHTYSTQDRERGTKGSKVLRTRKIRQHTNNDYYHVNSAWNYFCSTGCQSDFWVTYGNQIRQIAPRHEPLETPVDVTKEEREYGWREGTYTVTNIVDKRESVG